MQENASENIVWKMVAILSRPQCVKSSIFAINLDCFWAGSEQAKSCPHRGNLIFFSLKYQLTPECEKFGLYFADIFKCIFLNENVGILIPHFTKKKKHFF